MYPGWDPRTEKNKEAASNKVLKGRTGGTLSKNERYRWALLDGCEKQRAEVLTSLEWRLAVGCFHQALPITSERSSAFSHDLEKQSNISNLRPCG